MIPFEYSDVALKRRIAQLAAKSEHVLLTVHARKRMRERNVTLTQVLAVLQKGHVDEPAHRNGKGHWQCTLRRRVAGDDVRAVCALQEDADGGLVVVITVIR